MVSISASGPGAFAIGITPSLWLQACTLLLTLFLGFTKRRHELSLLNDKTTGYRPVLSHYTIPLLDVLITACATLTVVLYGLYTFLTNTSSSTIIHHQLFYSIVFVTFGIGRYLYLIHIKKLGDDPGELLFTDKPLLGSVLLWSGYIFLILYTHKLS